MRYVRFSQNGSGPRLGVLVGEDGVFPLSEVDPSLPGGDLFALIEELGRRDAVLTLPADAAGRALPVSSVRLLAPIPRPRHDILCLGVNYADHLEETKRSPIGGKGFTEPAKAVYFAKRAVRILGPGEAIEGRLDVDPALDYEVELAVILGKGGRDISVEDAESHVFGYSVFNDVSSRGLQKQHNQWFLGKSVDTYTAMGPVVVTADELPMPLELDVVSTVNGEERQHSNTRNLIHGIAEVIVELSSVMTLDAADIIATGTPSGVGMGFNPPRYMKPGDTVTCEIEGIGALTNVVR